jgi:hypothetical protein
MTTPDKLKLLNSHPRDADISFEEENHVYTVLGQRGTYTSTTTFIHHNFEQFNADKIIEGLIKKGSTNDPKNKYFGMTKQQIKEMWANNGKKASSHGTEMHYKLECYCNDMEVTDSSPEFQYFLNFRKDHPHLVPYRSEWTIFSEEEKISGSVDLVYRNTETNQLEIWDWKFVSSIEYDTNFNKYGITEHTKHLPDTNFWHYSLQLNTYKKILESKYGLTIARMCLLVLHESNSNYEIVEVAQLSREIEGLFAERRALFAPKCTSCATEST